MASSSSGSNFNGPPPDFLRRRPVIFSQKRSIATPKGRTCMLLFGVEARQGKWLKIFR
jgi:hypothetical protein